MLGTRLIPAGPSTTRKSTIFRNFTGRAQITIPLRWKPSILGCATENVITQFVHSQQYIRESWFAFGTSGAPQAVKEV